MAPQYCFKTKKIWTGIAEYINFEFPYHVLPLAELPIEVPEQVFVLEYLRHSDSKKSVE